MNLLRLSVLGNSLLHQLAAVIICHMLYLGCCKGEKPLPMEVTSNHDYCVIGAGPAGLQLGHFLEKTGRNYILFEKSNNSGHFFTLYPRHRKLISINKRNTGKTNKEFNMRHDWNSLLSDNEDLQMRHYSKVMFPDADVLVKYLDDFQRLHGINVQFNTEIKNIYTIDNDTVREGHTFIMNDQNDNSHTCRWIIAATGFWKPNIAKFPGHEFVTGYESISTDPDDYEGKSVLILGHGNSAFETADAIYGATSLVHMIGRSRVRLAWSTHYVGDVRAVNNGPLDTYQLKSMDGIAEVDMTRQMKLRSKNGKIQLTGDDDFFDNFSLRDSYDMIIRCLGFTFDDSLFANNTMPERGRGKLKKFPKINPTYESTNVPGLFFAGTLAHSLDFRESAGGFIHGFRYTARTLHRYLEVRNHGVPWPNVKIPVIDLLHHIIQRINEASGTYQMFQILGDIIIINKERTEVTYIEEFPLKMVHALPECSGIPADEIIVVVYQYGADFSGPGKDVFHDMRATGDPENAHKSNFLHPVYYHYKTLPTEEQMNHLRPKQFLPRPNNIHHTVEDFLTFWDAPISHIQPLRRFLENIFDKDLRQFYAQTCAKFLLTYTSVPLFCEQYYLKGQGLQGTQTLLNFMMEKLLVS